MHENIPEFSVRNCHLNEERPSFSCARPSLWQNTTIRTVWPPMRNVPHWLE